MSRKFVVLLSMLIGMTPFAIRADGPGVSATHVWMRVTKPDANALTGYMILKNLSNQTLTLATISSPDFESIVIRRGTSDDDKADLQPLSKLSIPAHKSLSFAPNSYYLVLIKPVKKLYDGDLVTLTLTFSDHSSLTIMAPVRRDRIEN
ncbi:MAG TPA: copper chaperone PCu(A)C [Gammaproteobacteria bacterium]|nr:copper chaperone PCu(A)C [Gammaproteobacteria bacterium]